MTTYGLRFASKQVFEAAMTGALLKHSVMAKLKNCKSQKITKHELSNQ